MRNFNNNRTVFIKGYLPKALKNIQELDAIMDAENPLIKELWQACEDCMNDQFISEATANGISRREKMLNITPFDTDTLDDRRFRLLTRYNDNIPYTRRSFENLLSSLCGAGGYKLKIISSDFTVDIKVALTAKKQLDSVRELAERILPYNMAFNVDLLYNQWEKVRSYTWGEVASLTWKELKEEDSI